MNSPFWRISRRLLRYRWTALAALGMAFVSAAGLGAGILGLVPVLNNILGQDFKPLPVLAKELDGRLGGHIPDPWIAALPDGRFDAVLWIVVLLGVLTVVGAAANFLHAYLSLTLTTRVVADVRRAAFRRLVHMPLGVVARGGGHDITSRILHDTNILNRGLQSLTSKSVAQLTKGGAALVAAFVISWRLSLVTLVVAPVLAVIIRTLGKRVRRASRGAMKGQAKLLEAASEVTRGFRVVKCFAAERHEIGRFTRHNRQVMREMLRARTASALASPLIETVAIFVLGALAIVAAKAIIDGALEPARFLLAMGALGVAGATLKPLNAVVQDIQTAEAAAQRLEEVLDAEPEDLRTAGRPRLPRHSESIEFQGVSLQYPGQESPAVDGVSLLVRRGETVAFVGPNGCGKTSLLSLVPRLFTPTAGRVLIDGVDTSGVSLRSLRRQIGVVSQETVLFSGTIATNIAYGTPGAARARIEDAARRAYAHDFIARQPEGYDTVVGDQGLTLSGGQRQRLAIARALLLDPSILILDEATSMIDSESEAMIARAIAEFARSRTCLVVAHRLATVVNADRIVVMNAGRVVDIGGHGALLARCPLYADLARHQLAVGAS